MRYVLILIAILLFDCDKGQPKDLELEISLSKLSLDNKMVIASIRQYFESVSHVPSVFCMTVQREDIETTTYTLSSMYLYSQVVNSPPSGYFLLDNHLILVYTGLERVTKRDEQLKAQLKRILGTRIQDDFLADGTTLHPEIRPMVYDPPVHRYKLKRDSLVDMGTVMDPFGPPLRPLKYVAPKL